jgi:hypothetical protein
MLVMMTTVVLCLLLHGTSDVVVVFLHVSGCQVVHKQLARLGAVDLINIGNWTVSKQTISEKKRKQTSKQCSLYDFDCAAEPGARKGDLSGPLLHHVADLLVAREPADQTARAALPCKTEKTQNESKTQKIRILITDTQ